ncbi:MAG: flagellar basal body P-ring protein FlgI [Phycisphaerales bacterium]|nr:flagellar basal body P-ring protein FlgI [Phycisphaerales bacterium]
MRHRPAPHPLLAPLLALCTLIGPCASVASAQTMTVQNISRMASDSRFKLQGLGLVMGLSGTGDSGKEMAMVRPLAAVLQKNGNPMPDLKELEKTKSVALVMVTCEIPAGGAKLNDSLDITVATLGTASSLEGGELFIAALTGPLPASPVYAMASGPIMMLDPAHPTTARVAAGAQIIKELQMPSPDTHFDLVLEPHYRGFAAAAQVATAINDNYFNTPAAAGMRIAKAADDRTIMVDIPEAEMGDKAAFIGEVMSTQVSEALLRLPPQVICNVRTGAITFTGDVRVSPVAVAMDGISIRKTEPRPVPTAADPLVTTTNWLGVTTESDEPGMTKLDDLLKAFDQLNIPTKDQISIIQQIHKQGCLHAKLIVE